MARLLFLLLLVTGGANAGPIIDTIEENGRTWAQIDLFSGLSWTQVNEVCAGRECRNETLNGYHMAGWYWASPRDAVDLMSHFGAPDPGSYPTQYFEARSIWAPAFFASGFRPTWDAGGPGIYAWTSEFDGGCRASGHGCGISLSVLDRTGIRESWSDLYEFTGINAQLRQPASGALFYYVPAPPSLVLIALGLFAVRFSRSLGQKRYN